jgi:hypothetical protein
MIIAIDFDGTCVTHEFPEIGSDIGAVPVLKDLVKNGHHLILFTMRSNNGILPLVTTEGIIETSGNFLDDAVNWFKENGIPLYGIQVNPTQSGWTTSPKAYAQLYIDDAAFGCPLIKEPEERAYVDWVAVKRGLIVQGIIKHC